MRQISLVQPSGINSDRLANVSRYHRHSHNPECEYEKGKLAASLREEKASVVGGEQEYV